MEAFLFNEVICKAWNLFVLLERVEFIFILQIQQLGKVDRGIGGNSMAQLSVKQKVAANQLHVQMLAYDKVFWLLSFYLVLSRKAFT